MCSPSDQAAWANTFALVAYIPDELGRYLNDLRRELVPQCTFASHVTVLPPRSLQGSVHDALDEIREHLRNFRAFEVSLDRVEIFPRTSVLYLAVGEGHDQLVTMHEQMSTRTLAYNEPFPFHPHVTLAQEFPLDQLDQLYELAQRRWKEVPNRRFYLDSLAFVRRRVDNNWSNLAQCELEPVAVVR